MFDAINNLPPTFLEGRVTYVREAYKGAPRFNKSYKTLHYCLHFLQIIPTKSNNYDIKGALGKEC